MSACVCVCEREVMNEWEADEVSGCEREGNRVSVREGK